MVSDEDWDKSSKWHFAIAGVKTNADELEVTSGVVLRRLHEFPTRKLMTDCLDNDLVVGLMQHYAINHAIEHELVVDFELLNDPIPVRELATNVLAGIRIRTQAELFCPAACEYSWMELGSIAKRPCMSALMEHAMYSHVPEAPKTITEDDLDWLNKHLSAMSDLNVDDRFAIAFRALSTYLHAADYRMMASQIWGGIESLIKARDHVSYSLSLWAALYLEPRGPNCGMRQSEIRKLYDKRSDVVHGREISIDDLKTHVESARRLLGQLLAKVIEAGKLPSEKDFLQLTTGV